MITKRRIWAAASCGLLMLITIGCAWAKVCFPFAKILAPHEVYEHTVDSVHTLRMDGRYGSAVSISEEILVTNCHVLGRGRLVLVDGQEKLIQIVNKDHKQIDLCFIYVPGMNFKPVNIRASKDVKMGEKVYAIGNPLGYEKTLSQGIISNKIDFTGSSRLQTDASISPGSSGGGLFDEYGNLIGITSAGVQGGSNINFAVPTEPVKNVLADGAKLITQKNREAAANYEIARKIIYKTQKEKNNSHKVAELKNCAKNNFHCQTYLAYEYYATKQYKLAYPLLTVAAEHNIEGAHYLLSIMYADGLGVAKNTEKAVEHSKKAAYLGDYQSAYFLGMYYSYKADTSKNSNEFKRQATLAYAWLKVSGLMGAVTDQKYQTPVTEALENMYEYFVKYKLIDEGDKLANEICDQTINCIRYTLPQEPHTVIK